jgi:topoisomerase-4 subunit A
MADNPGTLIDTPLGDLLSEKYLAYALSTIVSRSLPDVRDGLKPVHRRLLYAMRELGLRSASTPKKSAKVVGDVMGRFHPHGDAAIYEAMVRLAQDFASRYPLVEGQGNFGNIDGDGAAAMRYTEARLTPVAEALLAGLDENAADFRATYSGDDFEPVVLPGAFPNLLANGAMGIAVGMATSIPPHNVGELCAGLSYLIDLRAKDKQTPDGVVASALARRIPGPDFPTGGILVEEAEAIAQAYASGRGSFRLRARWKKEPLPQGQYQIVVSEIPFQVAKSRLIERIAELLNEKKLPLLEDIRDESAEDVRLVLVPKSRNVDETVLMESLFKASDLEVKIPLNLNVLDAETVPRVMSLREALDAFLDHRQVVLQRKSEHRLAKIADRLEVLEGFLIVYLNLDEVIRILRSEDEPKPHLIKRFTLSDAQAEHILNMRLRNLRKLEEMEIRKERDALTREQKDLKALLADQTAQWAAIAEEIKEIDRKFGASTKDGRRRTELGSAPLVEDIALEALVPKEPVTVICSAKGWIRAMKGHGIAAADVKYKDGDRAAFALEVETTDRLLLFATNGRFYTLGVDKLPGGRGFGEPIRLMIDLPNDADIIMMKPVGKASRYVVAAEDGRGLIVAEADALAQTKAGKQVLNLPDGGEAKACRAVNDGATHVAVIGQNRKMLVFPLSEVPEMARGRGVMLQKYKDGGLSDVTSFTLKNGLSWKRGDATRTEDVKLWLGERAQAGRIAPPGFPKSNRFD